VSSPQTSADPKSTTERRGLWAFWAATVLAVAGVIAPFLVGGGSSRLNASVIPFGVAAIAFAACSLFYHRGRPLTTLLYFVGSLGIVYGILSALAVPLRIAMLGACTAESGPCLPGLERPITTEESSALGVVIGIGIVVILTGFFGLRTLYRRHHAPARSQASPPPTPPVRRIAPVATKPPAEPQPAARSEAVAETRQEVEAQAELPAHEPDLELPAPSSEVPEPRHAGSTPPRQSQPRRTRPKAPPEPPTSTTE
jgi:hypothetical protein